MYFKASTSELSFTSDDWTEKTILDHDTHKSIADLPVLKTSLQDVMDPTPMDTNNNEAEEILPQETIHHHSETTLPNLADPPNEAAEITTNDDPSQIKPQSSTCQPKFEQTTLNLLNHRATQKQSPALMQNTGFQPYSMNMSP
ncbi:hypothetical protein DAPPUDRAFT_330915 [Daphnia pulex]|uniref:Uncharacterized protein n=1 Tax=Daphnia pulex TaxID=6669 RepID=E9HL00_DAPPU|nr:hypothetical protein DAPPUDRAFT_330915 [Daphnia pulex]|eukprot:EFX67584.1 hypothetical protein DAPPUDRAFT_330915 [Daphnia pulex]